MRFHRTEQNGELVLTYHPEETANVVELRYERELPERMRGDRIEKEPVSVQSIPVERVCEEKPRVSDALMDPKNGRRRSRVIAIAVALCFVLAIGCIGGGIWGIANSMGEFFSGSIIVNGGFDDNFGYGADDRENNDDSEDDDSSERDENRGDGTAPERDNQNEGKPQIGIYQPGENSPRFELVSAGRGRRTLTAGEIYEKVAPSTVTILGVYEEGYSVGTGIIFTADGYIATNYHVIAGCLDCEVWVTNEYGVDTVYKALMVGGDEDKDLAVLKIDAQALPAAEFGVSADLSVGDKVYAIGNPLGTELRSTFTDGIVSAVDRNVDVDGVTMTLIQTNTALNSGNSGGPLVNAYGQVIGINTIKMMSGYDTIEGLGFAIPSSIFERWINDILTTGAVRPSPILGLSVNRIPVQLPDGTTGLEVLEVSAGLGAMRAGVQVGDVVVAFNGEKINRVEDIYAQRLKLAVGDRVVIRVFRDGEYLDLTMTMMAEPE